MYDSFSQPIHCIGDGTMWLCWWLFLGTPRSSSKVPARIAFCDHLSIYTAHHIAKPSDIRTRVSATMSLSGMASDHLVKRSTIVNRCLKPYDAGKGTDRWRHNALRHLRALAHLACTGSMTYVSGHTMPDEAIANLSAYTSGSSVSQGVIDIDNNACPGNWKQRTGHSCSSMPGN